VSHPHLHETLTLNGLFVSLITEVLFDPSAHRDGALVFVAVLGVRYAEQDKLLTDLAHAPLVGEHQLALAAMSQDALHLNAARQFAVRVVAFCCVHKVANALFNGGLSLFSGVLGPLLKRCLVVKTKPQLVHGVLMADRLVARHTHIKILYKRNREYQSKCIQVHE
jgi:hypothetical protein